MKIRVWLLLSCVLLSCAFGYTMFSCGGETPSCKTGDTKDCKCGEAAGKQACKTDGTYDVCNCGSGTEIVTAETVDEGKTSTDAGEEAVVAPEPEPGPEAGPEPEPGPEAGPEPEPGPEVGPETETVSEDDGSTSQEQEPENAPDLSCQTDEFLWQGKCYKHEAFCTSTTSNSAFPIFTKEAIAAMAQPYQIEFDIVSGSPLFCKTKDGYYYLSGSGYGICDADKDGWINIEAYRAVTSTDKQIQNNARCTLKKIEAVVYHAEGNTQAQVQTLTTPAYLVETARNDGGKKLIEVPMYTDNQTVLPKTTGSACTQDSDCKTGEVCYIGNCLKGRRFDPAEINTLSKACISGIDLNDNQLDDANESPSDTPTPSSEFKPLLNLGYFVEIHYGHHEAGYTVNSKKMDVYHIYERSRSLGANKQGLALKCQESSGGFDPDYWKKCTLKDDQQCDDPQNPGTLKSGLSQCWMKDVKQAIPSLFKCVVHDNATDKTKNEGYFHPDNYGFSNKYNRALCKVKGSLNTTDPTKRDLEFECSVDDSNRKPDPSKKEVGWACVSFRSYTKSTDYLAGCIDEKAEQVCGTKKDGKDVTYITLEKDSYGLVRAKAECGTSNGKGECDFAQRVCSGGNWLDCDKCNNCPQDTAGAKATCPNATWPSDSCKLLKGPVAEVCNGLDDDCDGSIDENLATLTYYKDEDGDGYGDKTKPITKCKEQIPSGYVANSTDCNDADKNISPAQAGKDVCDGIDNDCDGSVDEDASKFKYYQDNDGDSYGGTFAFEACVHNTDATKLCKKLNDCVTKTYTYSANGQTSTREYTKDSQDCCDTDANAKPGQTTYFSAQNACGKWDYNCDGKDTTDVTTCQCSKSVKYTESGYAKCGYGSDENAFSSWRTESCTDCTTTNSTSCELAVTYTFAPTSDFTLEYSCTAKDLIGDKHTCKKTHTVSKSTVTYSWSPKAADNTNLLVFESSKYSNGCVFKTDGTLPGCGESGYVAGSTEPTPSKTEQNSRFDSGSHQCDPCGICDACSSKSYYCTAKWTTTMSSSYKYIKRPTNQTIIKCR